MNILMITDVLFPDTVGGAGRVAYHLALELGDQGHDVYIISRNIDGKQAAHEQFQPNVHVHRFYIPARGSVVKAVREIANSLLSFRKLNQQVRFDFVCIHQSFAALGPMISRHFRKLPSVYFYHSPWHEEYLSKKTRIDGIRFFDGALSLIMKWAEHKMATRALKVFVLSAYMGGRLRDIHGCPENNIAWIPGGVDTVRFSIESNAVSNRASKTLRERVFFLTIRNLVPRMGLENLVKAFHESDTLRKKGFLTIGGSGMLEKRLRDMVDAYDLKDTVRLIGHIPDGELPEIYQKSDFFVLPTERLEGFGLVILESLSCGTPVIGTPVGAIPEIIGKFDRNHIFEGPDANSMRKKLEHIVTDPTVYDKAPEECRRFVLQNFTWEKMAARFLAELKRAINGHFKNNNFR